MAYCIDVETGPKVHLRSNLIVFLKDHITRGKWPHALVAMHGMWENNKSLRILTEHAWDLREYIIENFDYVQAGGDPDDVFHFTIHESEEEAQQAPGYVFFPDYETEEGFAPFNL